MRRESRCGWLCMVWVSVALATGCSDKGDDTSAAPADSGTTATTDDGCASGQGVLRVAVADSGGGVAPSGTTVHAEGGDATVTDAEVDEFGDARLNLPSDTYRVWADNPGAGLASAEQSLPVPGCQTTSLSLVLAAAR